MEDRFTQQAKHMARWAGIFSVLAQDALELLERQSKRVATQDQRDRDVMIQRLRERLDQYAHETRIVQG